jgi:uncharacterized protein YwqG
LLAPRAFGARPYTRLRRVAQNSPLKYDGKIKNNIYDNPKKIAYLRYLLHATYYQSRFFCLFLYPYYTPNFVYLIALFMTKKELKELFRQNRMSSVWNMVEPKLKNAVRIQLQPCEESRISLGQSKIGGLPDLPQGQTWFYYNEQPMSFVAQINLAEVAPFDIDNRLPNEGILYFFYDAEQAAWGFDPKHKGASKVFYFNGDFNLLQTQSAPDALDDSAIFAPAALEFSSQVNMPDYESDLLYDIDLEDEEYALYSQLDEAINDRDYLNKILGHANNIQSGMELECELVRNGLYCGDSSGFKSPKAKALKRQIENWHLLLQVDSNDQLNMIWGDAGRLFFWIREEDLKSRNFDAAWLMLQSC